MKTHVALVQEQNKPLKGTICEYCCPQKGILKKHKTSVHEENKPFNVAFVTTDVLIHEQTKPFKWEF